MANNTQSFSTSPTPQPPQKDCESGEAGTNTALAVGIVAICLVVLGWIVLHLLAKDRDHKSKIKQIRLDQMLSAVNEIAISGTQLSRTDDLPLEKRRSLAAALITLQTIGTAELAETARSFSIRCEGYYRWLSNTDPKKGEAPFSNIGIAKVIDKLQLALHKEFNPSSTWPIKYCRNRKSKVQPLPEVHVLELPPSAI